VFALVNMKRSTQFLMEYNEQFMFHGGAVRFVPRTT